jgi:sRNA-binding carbon storage regulator CsrA
MGLVITREPGQTIVVDGPAVLRIEKVGGKRVCILVEAPPQTKILRGELVKEAAEQ